MASEILDPSALLGAQCNLLGRGTRPSPGGRTRRRPWRSRPCLPERKRCWPAARARLPRRPCQGSPSRAGARSRLPRRLRATALALRAAERDDVGHLRPALGEGAGLVHGRERDPAEVLQNDPAPYEQPAPRTHRKSRGDGRGCRDDEGARTADEKDSAATSPSGRHCCLRGLTLRSPETPRTGSLGVRSTNPSSLNGGREANITAFVHRGDALPTGKADTSEIVLEVCANEGL